MYLQNGVFICLGKFFHLIVEQGNETFVVAKMTAGRRCTGIFFPLAQSLNEFLHSYRRFKAFNLAMRVRKEKIHQRVWM